MLWTTFANAQSESGGEQRRIREIRIEIAPIYTAEQAEKSSWAEFTNSHHNPVNESVIRTALLFEEGDVLDEELLRASERYLRWFKFLNRATISPVPVDDETVDIEVGVKEAWTLEPGINFSGGGGLATVSAHLINFNLFGSGKKAVAKATYESDVGTTWKFGYSDYQLFNGRWLGSASYRTGPLTETYHVSARLPLFSPDSKWAYGGYAYKGDLTKRLFEDGEESSRYGEKHIQVGGSVKRSFGPRFKKTNLQLGLKYLDADYSSLGSQTTIPPPPDLKNITPSIGISTGSTDWVKHAYIDKMGITEDDWLGLRYGLKVGYSIPLDDTLELWDTRVFISKSMALGNQQLLYLNAAVSSEIARNTITMLGTKYYKRFSRHTLALRFKTKVGSELDSSKQFYLGASNGLRGYPARQFTGEKLVLMNLEDRQFWGSFSMGPKFNFGTVVFVDAGNVWKDDQDIDLGDLHWSTGFGFRVSMANIPKQPILRVDLGWAIGNEHNFEVTVGAEQQF